MGPIYYCIFLILDSKNTLQEAFIEWDETLRSIGMLINVKKSEIIQVGGIEEEIESINIACNREELEQVPCCEYLELLFNRMGKYTKK
jgi:hypothetical protein